MSIDSLKRVLMATKEKARGMRKDKLENRLNPKSAAPALAIEIETPADGKPPEENPLDIKRDPSRPVDIGDESMAPEMEEAELGSEGPPSEEEKAAALEEIRALLARV